VCVSAVAGRTRGLDALDVRGLAASRRDGAVLRLVARDGGWSLVRLDGECVFAAPGTGGRQRCLELACAEGVLALLS
jgi:hypothetical protein